MPSAKVIEWCGVCWLSGARSFATIKVRKLPLCQSCFDTFGDSKEEVDHLFAVWDAMPDHDEREAAGDVLTRMLGCKDKTAIEVVSEYLKRAKRCKRGGSATSYLQSVLNVLKYGTEIEPETIKYWEEQSCLRKARKTLTEIKSLLRDPQKLREAGSQQEPTSPTS